METAMMSLRSPTLSVLVLLVTALTPSIATAIPKQYNQASGAGLIPNSTSCATGYLNPAQTAECTWSGSYSYAPLNLTQTVGGSASADVEAGVAFATASSSDSGQIPSASGSSAAIFVGVRDYNIPPGTQATMTLTMMASSDFSPADKFSTASGYMSVAYFNANNGDLIGGGVVCPTPHSVYAFNCNQLYGDTEGSVSWVKAGGAMTVTTKIDLNKYPDLQMAFEVGANVRGNATAAVNDPITIDVTPGVTWTDPYGPFLTGATRTVTEVPEPASWLPLALGFLAVGCARRACHIQQRRF
jgi:hypothetical protein